ncbi:exported hypothetical protein [uncultured Desulfatiglans sp.]|nr:exported hypothetical protein [uncultured Desulfatiglans sp.]
MNKQRSEAKRCRSTPASALPCAVLPSTGAPTPKPEKRSKQIAAGTTATPLFSRKRASSITSSFYLGLVRNRLRREEAKRSRNGLLAGIPANVKEEHAWIACVELSVYHGSNGGRYRIILIMANE